MSELARGGRYSELEITGRDLSRTRLEGASFTHCAFASIEADVARHIGLVVAAG